MSAPAGLQASGGRFWRETVEQYELDPDDLLILERVCRTVDRVARNERAEARLAAIERTVKGSRGQLTMHPISKEVREDTLLLCRLLEQLALPDKDQEVGTNVASRRGQRAAQARWNGGRKAS